MGIRPHRFVRVHGAADGEIINADEDYAGIDQKLSGIAGDKDKIINKCVGLPTTRRINGFKQNPFAFFDIMLFKLFRFDGYFILYLDDAGRSDGSFKR